MLPNACMPEHPLVNVSAPVWSDFAMLAHTLLLFAWAATTSAAVRLANGRLHANIPPTPTVPIIDISDFGAPVTSRNGTELPPYNTTYYFDQLIDHEEPSLGTFKQRFWHTYEFYEPGGPIILFTPGEANAQRKCLFISLYKDDKEFF